MADPSDVVVIAQGGVPDMREMCDYLRHAGIEAALQKPPGKGGG